jgi:hypothetical protein
VIIRISRRDGSVNERWWEQARASAVAGRAQHGIHTVILDPGVTHVDVFPTEAGEVWAWAARFEGWMTDGRTQLKREPYDTLQSTSPPVTVDQLKALLPGRPRND